MVRSSRNAEVSFTKLNFDPEHPPHGVSLPDGGERDRFVGWFRQREKHHEFPELANRLSRYLEKLGAQHLQWNFGYNLFWNTWRAATWRQFLPELRNRMHQHALNFVDQAIQRARNQGLSDDDGAEAMTRYLLSNPPDPVLEQFQHGPFVWAPQEGDTEPPLCGKTNLPDPGTMLAAQIAYISKHGFGVAPDWQMLSLLLGVAEIDEAPEPNSLRNSANRLIKLVSDGKALLVAWPQDTGPTFGSLNDFMDRAPQGSRPS
jgi:hypothetical protein